MGHRNPDRIPLSWRRTTCETVADMARARWDVISKCQACGLTMQVQLRTIAVVSGPSTSLWNRRAPCRRLLCRGQVEFWAKAPGMASHETLTAEWPDGKPPIGVGRSGRLK
jgi:hypothetical protein